MGTSFKKKKKTITQKNMREKNTPKKWKKIDEYKDNPNENYWEVKKKKKKKKGGGGGVGKEINS